MTPARAISIAFVAHAACSELPSKAPRSKVRWGIMGTGSIAADFTRVLAALPDAEVAAIGSRTADRASTFAAELGLDGSDTTLHGSYDDLIADDSLDIVYVATPSLRHVDDSLACLRAGRAVLCEKSMAETAERAEQVLACARERGLFFCHGVWSRFFPSMAKIREALAAGAIGDVVSAHASFCQADGAGACSATLETGIYCAQFLQWAFDGEAPEAVEGVTYSLEEKSGLDQHVGALLRFSGGRVGTFECSLRHPTPRSATICGTKGVITVPFPFWCPTSFSVQTMTGLGSQTWSAPAERTFALPAVEGPFNFVNSEGLAYEAAEVNACLRAGRSESEFFDHRENLAVMDVLSQIRARWGAA